MSRRLLASFTLVVVVLVTAVACARAYAISGELRALEAAHANAEARQLAGLVAEGQQNGEDPAVALDRYADATQQVELRRDDRVVAAVEPADQPQDPSRTVVTGRAVAGDLTVVVREPSLGWRGVMGLNPASFLALLALAAVLAGAAGWGVARWLGRPFTRLAEAGHMLTRGRTDLDLPRSSIPEVRDVAGALEASAALLRDRMTRDEQFAGHASHALRTPLTSLRLHLDEIAGQPLDPAGAAATRRCQDTVEELGTVVADLVGMTRGGALLTGAGVPLRDLAAAAAQRWADGLVGLGRGFSAAVEGDLDLVLTPGPVEHVLDVLLERARAAGGGAGDVRLVVEGNESAVRLEVTGVRWAPGDDPSGRADQARDMVTALGGRVLPLPGDAGVRVLLPPR